VVLRGIGVFLRVRSVSFNYKSPTRLFVDPRRNATISDVIRPDRISLAQGQKGSGEGKVGRLRLTH
jgi:hypothetical protein